MAQNLRSIHQLSQAISYVMPKQAIIWLAKKLKLIIQHSEREITFKLLNIFTVAGLKYSCMKCEINP